MVSSQSQTLADSIRYIDDPDRSALAKDLAAQNVAYHDELFHIIEHTNPFTERSPIIWSLYPALAHIRQHKIMHARA